MSEPPLISVMLIVPDAGAAVAWYQAALGATELWNLGGVTNVRVELFRDDPDGFVGRALAAGAVHGSAVVKHQMPWGTHRQGGFTDPFGHKWSVGDKSPLR